MIKKAANLNLLDGVTTFVAVVNAQSFTEAAQVLGCSTSHVSKEISRLEDRLGSRLLNRSTRTLNLTHSGKTYYERCQKIVIDSENAERSINQLQDTLRGLLRVNVPVSFGLTYLRECLSQFMQRHPEITVEVEFNDRMIDVVAEGYDVVIRAGDSKDSNLVARKFMQSRGVVVASPDYLAKNGYPLEAKDLERHDCISYSYSPNPSIWEFKKGNEQYSINVKPRLICNNAELEVAMAV